MNIRPRQTRRRPSRDVRPDESNARLLSYRSSAYTTDNRKPSEVSDRGRHNRNQTTGDWRSLVRNLPSRLAVFAIIGSLVYVTTLDTQINLTNHTLASSESLLRPKTAYELAAESILSESIFNRSKLTIDVVGFEKKMLERFSELDSVSLVLPLAGHQPIVSLVSKKPLLKLISAQGVYLIDDQGLAIIKSSDVGPGLDGLELPSVTDESQLEINLGRGALTANASVAISQISKQLTAKQVSISSMTLPSTNDELKVTLNEKSYYIKFGLANDPKQSVGEYLALIEKLARDGITPREYIDLRVPERAFYR
jgi:hypothetical protein